jgi:hypothetical protein
MGTAQWRKARRTFWKWHIFARHSGATRAGAVETAKQQDATYEGDVLQCSTDGGLTWHDAPDVRVLPVIDETRAATGEVWGDE